MNERSTFQALVVDFGGVLTTPLQEAMVAFTMEAGIDLQDFVRAALGVYTGAEDDLVVKFETGAISEDEFARAFALRLNEATGKTVDPEGLVARMFAGLRVEEKMFEAMKAARDAGLKTALLSNSWGPGLYPRERIDELFDVIVISEEVGLRKPDPEIFELTVRRLDVAPRQCVFVDDHPDHLKAALDAGMKTVLHRSPEQTISELEELLGISLSTGSS
jgi:epoxide hydrolase-like predicted phosphatase